MRTLLRESRKHHHNALTTTSTYILYFSTRTNTQPGITSIYYCVQVPTANIFICEFSIYTFCTICFTCVIARTISSESHATLQARTASKHEASDNTHTITHQLVVVFHMPELKTVYQEQNNINEITWPTHTHTHHHPVLQTRNQSHTCINKCVLRTCKNCIRGVVCCAALLMTNKSSPPHSRIAIIIIR